MSTNSLNSAAVGMKTHQTQIDTIANNIANVNTSGFKRSRIDLKDAAYTQMVSASPESNQNNLLSGNSVLPAAVTRDFSPGALVETNRNMDVAIQSNSFLAVENSSGEQQYSRSGNLFARDSQGVRYLANANGDFILDRNGNRIRINFPPEQIEISPKGEVSDGKNEPIATLAVYKFENPAGLNQLGNNSFSASALSGQPLLAGLNDNTVKSGFLESSNVDLVNEMTQLIKSQRAYTFLSRAVTTADNIKATENDIRR